MRILIISKYFPPENSVASLRPFSWAKYWSKAGHQVSVLTTIKDNSRAEAIPLNTNSFVVNEIDFSSYFYKLKSIYKNKVNVAEAAQVGKPTSTMNTLPPFNNKGILKKALVKVDEWRKKRGLFLTARMPDTVDLWIKPATEWAKMNGPWDLVVSTHGPYACHLIGLNIKNLNLTKYWIADFRDLWTNNHIFRGVFPFILLEHYFEKKILHKANIITTVSHPLAETLRNKYPKSNIHVIENGFDTDELQELPKEHIFQDNKVRIIQTGTVYKGRMSPLILFKAINDIYIDSNLAPLLDKLEVIFLGSDNSFIMDLAKKMNVSKWVIDGGFLPRKDILRMQRESHILLYLGFDKSKAPGLLSGKMYEYMFSETPIWAVEVDTTSTVGQIFQEANAGIIFGDDQASLKQHLIQLLQNPVKQKANTNKKYLENFERSKLAYKMLSLLPVKV